MSGAGGLIAEVGELGWLPARNHDPATPVNRKALMFGGLIVRDETKDPLQRLRPDLDTPEDTLGDFEGAHYWLREPGQRECSAWFFGPTPAVVVGTSAPPPPRPGQTRVRRTGGAGALLPLLDLDTPATEFKPRAPRVSPWASKFPGGWTGIGAVTVEDNRMVDTFHPDFLGVIAPSFGNPDHGTRVFDCTPQGQLDRQRWAYLQQHLCVLDMGPQGPCDLSGYVLATQLGGDKLGGKAGYALFADHDNGWFGSASKKHGGPFMLGPGCRHSQGPDADGNDFRPVHVSHETNFLWPGVADAPLGFEANKWEFTNPDGPHWLKAHIRYNGDSAAGSTVCGKFYPGAFEVQVGTHVYVPPDPDPPPPPPDPPPPPPETGDIGFVDSPELTPVPGVETTPGGDSGDQLTTGPELNFDGTPVSTHEGELAPGVHGPNVTGLDADLGIGLEPATPVELEVEPINTDGPGVVNHGNGPLTPTVGDAGTYRPAYPHTTACLAVPGLLLKGTSWAKGSADVTGASLLSDEDKAAYEDAPFVGHFAGFSVNKDGEWGGFTLEAANDTNRYARSSGGVTLLPPGVGVADLANSAAGEIRNTLTTYFVLAPEVGSGGARLALAQPDPTTGGIKSGMVFDATSSTLTATPVDSSGVEGTPVDLLGGGGSTPHTDSDQPGMVEDTTNNNGETFGFKTYTELLNDGGGGSFIDILTPIPVGAVIHNVTTRVVDEFDGSGATAGVDQVLVGIAADTNKWGASGNITAGTTTGPADYTADPRVYVTSTSTGTIRITASAFTMDGGGSIRVTVQYSWATPPTA